jgi:hypothetical protein
MDNNIIPHLNRRSGALKLLANILTMMVCEVLFDCNAIANTKWAIMVEMDLK